MDDKKKILLGDDDIIAKSNEDIFINLNINKTFAEIRDEKFENVFDVSKQFSEERNASRDFRIYGTIDSTVTNCDALQLSAYDSAFSGTGGSSGTTFLSGFVKSFSASSLVYNGFNTYGKKKGKFLLELTGYTKDFVYIKIPTNGLTYKDQIYSQQLIFKDADGTFVNYGTKTIEVDENGNAIQINNDFYFLYNKHWVKKDLSITIEQPAKLSFSASPLVGNINEVPSATLLVPLFLSAFVGAFNFGIGLPVAVLAAGFPSIVPFLYPVNIVLDKPSAFGLEKATISIQSSTINPATELIFTDDHLIQQALPLNISFLPGESVKTFYVFSPQDNLQEFLENVIFKLDNIQNANSGSPLTHTINVIDSDVRNKVTLNFQSMYQNRDYFTGIHFPIGGNDYSFPMPAVLRNGLNYEGTPMEFYPIENYTLKIINTGTDTIMPVNTMLGINSEITFPAGQSLSFNIIPQYQNLTKHSVRLYFSNANATSNINMPLFGAGAIGLTINGVPIVDYYKSYKVDYEKFSASLRNTTVASTPFWGYVNQNIGGWGRYNLDIPFDVTEDISGQTLTLTAKIAGTRLDIKSYGGFPDIFDSGSLALQTFGITAVTVQAFTQSAQTPLQIVLGANTNANSQAQYAFEISKTGYDKMTFTSSTLNATASAPIYYLASGYHDILRNWDNAAGTPIYIHSAVTSNWPTYYTTTFGYYTMGEAYINGIVLLANLYFDNTVNTNSYFPNGGALNRSHFTNVSGSYRADFKLAPISVIPQTNEFFSPQSAAQVSYLGMQPAVLPVNASPTRSFDFRTGSTAPYNTYYSDYWYSYISWEWNSYNSFFSSGGTFGTNKTTPPGQSIKIFLQNGNPTYSITDQGLLGTTPVTAAEVSAVASIRGPGVSYFNSVGLVKLVGKTPGVPFEFKNFKEIRYSSGPFIGLNASSDSLFYVKIRPAEILGFTINEANNFMGGYTLLQP